MQVEIDFAGLGQVEHMLAQAMAIWSDTSEMFDQIGASLITSTQQRFEDQVDAEGHPWELLSPETIERRQGDETPILQVDGNLYNSLDWAAGHGYVQLGTNWPSAAAHQFGRSEINLAPRPFLPTEALPDDDVEAINKIVRRILQRGFQ